MIDTPKTILAKYCAVLDTPEKPKKPAISAIIKKSIAHLNISISFV